MRHVSENHVFTLYCLQETLKTLRQLDDKIIYKLNQTVPTESFKHEINAESQCRELYSEVPYINFNEYDIIMFILNVSVKSIIKIKFN